jgi:hypothetical protein
MLDAFIIEKIKRERDQDREAPRLRITPPEPKPHSPLPSNSDRREEKGPRGVVEIDFNLDSEVDTTHINFTI